MAHRHSHTVPGGRGSWSVERLWRAAERLPVRQVAIADIAEFERDCWFGGSREPTCRAVAEHARRIRAADLDYPIILSSDGRLMDGGHRIAKAWLLGQTEIAAVRFEVDPTPDFIAPLT
jgi:hypothetical protein